MELRLNTNEDRQLEIAPCQHSARKCLKHHLLAIAIILEGTMTKVLTEVISTQNAKKIEWEQSNWILFILTKTVIL